jgi:hypothetical protein
MNKSRNMPFRICDTQLPSLYLLRCFLNVYVLLAVMNITLYYDVQNEFEAQCTALQMLQTLFNIEFCMTDCLLLLLLLIKAKST